MSVPVDESEPVSTLTRNARHASPPRARGTEAKVWQLSWPAVMVAIVALAGVTVFTYPTAASWFSQYNQSKLIEAYNNTMSAGTDPPAAEEVALARQYNDALSSGALLEANERLPTGAGTSIDDSLSYDQILNAGSDGLMARIKIPSIDVDLPIYHGTSDETLLRGAGHLEGTSLPVGGESTHSVITAHRGLANATMFTNLNRVEIGDTFTIEVFGEVLTYQVFETKVVEPDETEAIRTQEGLDIVTLVTCTPLGVNSHRILVTGERVWPTPLADIEAAGAEPEIPRFPWWALWLAASVIVAGVYIWRNGYRPVAAAKTPKDDNPAPEPDVSETAPATTASAVDD